MFVYNQCVLRRRLLSLLVIIIGLYAGLSTFGITNDQAQESASDQSTITTEDSNPYSAIMRANVFHLTDPPKPVEKPDAILLNLPKINITGFTRRSDQPVHALFATVPKDPKDSPKYFNLTEGEKEDILQVVKIHPGQDAVDVVIAGTPVTLTTKSNSFIQPLPPPPKGGVPGVPAVASAAYNPRPVQQVASTQAGNYGGVIVAGGGITPGSGGSSVTTIGSNPGSTGLSSAGNGGSPGAGFGGPSYAAASGTPFQSVPTRGQLIPNYPSEYHPQSMHESAAMMAVDAQMHEADIQSGKYPPPPPMPGK